MLKQSVAELLPINQNDDSNNIVEAKKIISSYASAFNELASICQLKLEFDRIEATLNESKFIDDMDAFIKFGVDPLALLVQDEDEKTELSKIKMQLQAFIESFNELDQSQRIIIYYSYFKNESAIKIAQLRSNEDYRYSESGVWRKKNEASILLVKKLKWHKIRHKIS